MSWSSLGAEIARSFLWLLVFLLPFLYIQRWLHRELQAVFLLLTRRPTVALVLFSLLFFPGILLHESSHYLMARLLRVRTGRFSLLPYVLPDGRLRLGFVETARVDLLRDALIGTAPLFSGGILIAVIGSSPLGFAELAAKAGQGEWDAFWQGVIGLPGQQDFWLWLYLAFVISSTMMPSDADRRAWLPMALSFGVLVGLAVFAGAGPWMLAHLAPWLTQALYALAMVFGISLVVHLALAVPVGLVRYGLTKLTGLTVR